MTLRLRSTAALLALAAACGNSGSPEDEKHYQDFKAACTSLSGQTVTYQQAIEAMPPFTVAGGPGVVDCETRGFVPVNQDVCQYGTTTICQESFCELSLGSRCGGGVAGGCWYACNVRFAITTGLVPGLNNTLPPGGTPICAVEFLDGLDRCL